MTQAIFIRAVADLTLTLTDEERGEVYGVVLKCVGLARRGRAGADTLPPPRDPLVTLPEVG
jgi:hypothetical protein